MIEARPGGARVPLALAGLLFALAGVGALIVQTLWLRELRLALGGASAATAATLVALVVGQAGGARLGERIALRAASPLRAFGLLALVAALGALATPYLLGATTALLDTQYDALLARPALLALARGAAALTATLPAALAIGALAPALFAACLGGARSLASAGVALYALNALGGALGAALATFWWVERLGLRGSLALGAALLFAAGSTGLAAARSAGRAPAHDGLPAEAANSERLAAPPLWLLQLAALSGFGSFAAQSLFAQALGRVSNQSAYAFGSVLVVSLACVGLGALFVYSLSRRARAQLTLGVALALTGCALLVFPAYFVGATGGLAVFSVDAPWPAYLRGFAALAFATAGSVLLPAACVFPSLLAVAEEFTGRGARALAAASARLLLWNAGGALLGALVAPFVLVPVFGLWGAIACVGAAYLLGALRLLARAAAPRFAAYAALLGALLFVVARPYAQPALRVPKDERLLQLEESAAGLVAVFEGKGGRKLQLDNHYFLGGARDRVHQERQGHLPLLLHPSPKRVLFLGSATGSSASAALAHAVESITLVEIVPGVARAAREFFRDENHGVYDDPRTRVVIDDARSFLRASPEQFDVIVGDLFVPWQSGSGSLFSVEHFANARTRLAERGVFCQWLPLYQLTQDEFLLIARSFSRVFPAADVFRGDFYGTHPIVAFCGTTQDAAFDPWRDVRLLRGAADRWISGRGGPTALYVGRAAASWQGWPDEPVESDASPLIEFAAARAHSGGAVVAPFVGTAWVAFSRQIARAGIPAPPGTLDASGGLALQSASALFAAGRTEEAGEAFSLAEGLLDAELVRDAPPDPSASELWHTRSD